MNNKKAPVFTLIIIVIIVGVALYKQINFATMTVEKPWLSVLYALTLVFALFSLIRHYNNKPGA